jgi:hypothetical protein
MDQSTSYPDSPTPKLAGLDEDGFNSHQEAVPVPHVSGTRQVAPIWITNILEPEAHKAPAERPGKK